MTAAPDIEVDIVELEPQTVAVVRGEVPIEGMPAFFGRAFGETVAAIEAAGLTITGPPFGYYADMPADVVVVEAGFPTSAPIETTGDVHALTLPGGRAVVTTHVGPYETLEVTYAALEAWLAAEGHVPAPGMWECYLSDPEAEPDPAKWETRIVWPVLR